MNAEQTPISFPTLSAAKAGAAPWSPTTIWQDVDTGAYFLMEDGESFTPAGERRRHSGRYVPVAAQWYDESWVQLVQCWDCGRFVPDPDHGSDGSTPPGFSHADDCNAEDEDQQNR